MYLSCDIWWQAGNKKTYQYELIRLQPINLVFAQNSTFCACVGRVLLKTCPQMLETDSNTYFVNSLSLHDKQAWQCEDILQIMSVFFATLIHVRPNSVLIPSNNLKLKEARARIRFLISFTFLLQLQDDHHMLIKTDPLRLS